MYVRVDQRSAIDILSKLLLCESQYKAELLITYFLVHLISEFKYKPV